MGCWQDFCKVTNIKTLDRLLFSALFFGSYKLYHEALPFPLLEDSCASAPLTLSISHTLQEGKKIENLTFLGEIFQTQTINDWPDPTQPEPQKVTQTHHNNLVEMGPDPTRAYF